MYFPQAVVLIMGYCGEIYQVTSLEKYICAELPKQLYMKVKIRE